MQGLVIVSSRTSKDNIIDLKASEAMEALRGLNPVRFNYKTDETEKHVGFIAEDVPDLVAKSDRAGIDPMDIVAVLTKVVQEQNRMIQKQQNAVDKLKREMAALKNMLNRTGSGNIMKAADPRQAY